MISSITDHLVEVFVRNSIIKEDERDLYRFGMNHLFRFLLNVITAIVIGIIFQMVWQSILFSITYIPLRQYAGGFHATTPGRCFVLSTLLIACALLAVSLVPWGEASVFLASMVLSGSVILLRAPVESVNKPLDEKEYVVFRKKSRVIALIELGCAIICIYLGFVQGAGCILTALLAAAVMVCIPEKR